jgi:hypothetical protein
MAKKTYVPGYGYVEQGSPGTSGSVRPGRKPVDTGQNPNFNKELYGKPKKPKTPAGTSAAAPATAVPPPVRTQVRIDVTPNKQVGKPAGVKAAEADKMAALAQLAAEQKREDVALRDAYSQNLMAAQSSAADVYGGRAPAIFGQGVTGARRQFVSGRSAMVQENVGERAALERAYNEAIRQAYVAAAQQRQADADRRVQLAMMTSQTMGY